MWDLTFGGRGLFHQILNCNSGKLICVTWPILAISLIPTPKASSIGMPAILARYCTVLRLEEVYGGQSFA